MPASPGESSAPGAPLRTWAGALWFWSKVVLCLVALDALLFGTGLFWDIPISWRGAGADSWVQAYRIARQIETRPVDEPLAIAVGSSAVRMTLQPGIVEGKIAKLGVPGAFASFGLDGATASDAALVAGASRRLEPWLVIYGAETRDFYPDEPLMVTDALFRDSETEHALPGELDLDERISLLVKTHWRLYRYRPLARIILREQAGRMLGRSIADVSEASPVTPAVEKRNARRARTPQRRRLGSTGEKADAAELWQRWRETRDFADYEAYLSASKRGIALAKYKLRRETPLDLDSNPQVDALRWMLDHCQRRGSRVLVAYFPENPVFRDPKADTYFDPALSDRTASMLAREAKRAGAGFVDLRNVLPAEDFQDMLHLRESGRAKLMERIAQLIAEEWRSRAERTPERAFP